MSVHKTRHGTYVVKWRCERKLQSKSFSSLQEAKDFDSRVRMADVPIKRTEYGQMSFARLANEYLDNYARVSKEASSVGEDQSILRNHLLPTFRNLRIGMIDFREASLLRAELVKRGLKRKTVNNIFCVLKRIFTLAVRWGYLQSNPIIYLEPLKVQSEEMRFWSFEDLTRFLIFAQERNRDLFEIVAVATKTGLRFGEQRGLLRDALDFSRREILVKRTYCSRIRKIVPRTKGKKDRRIPMNQMVYDILKRRAMSSTDDEIFRFDLNNFRDRWFVPAINAAQVPMIRYHDLRHTFASHLAMKGVSMIKIKELMGHSDFKTTLRYTHLAPNQLEGITDVLLESSPMVRPPGNSSLSLVVL